MKNKVRHRASKAANRGKSAKAARKPALLRRAQAAARRPAAPKGAGADEAKSAVRRLRLELTKARTEIEQLKATAETDFLLDIL
ncbi:MAG TPA: GGDEF domain-containing protein, partial [Reyranella sp.]|nr:GGDEF domain-containing protein [Reyranella sp.]